MVEKQLRKGFFGRSTDRGIDCIVTLVCWVWFTLGFILFFSWLYLAAALFSRNQELRFQQLNSRFYRIFFKIVELTCPRHTIHIEEDVAAIRSAVIVCNHLSYLDPLLLIALFSRQKTIVKSRFFEMPIFGMIISKSGYFPDKGNGRFTRMMIAQMETMGAYLKDGGNLFVFPEGTRSRNGKFGTLNKGALKIARICQAPIYVLQLQNTDKLFTPGKFIFNTRVTNTISMKIIDCITPDYTGSPPTTNELEQRVRRAYSGREL
jgi:1-acyl-sn-glycerol-3-phosphate acyltransferase